MTALRLDRIQCHPPLQRSVELQLHGVDPRENGGDMVCALFVERRRGGLLFQPLLLLLQRGNPLGKRLELPLLLI